MTASTFAASPPYRPACSGKSGSRRRRSLRLSPKSDLRPCNSLGPVAIRLELAVSAQRSWVAFRDAECTSSSSRVAGGSVYPMVYSTCLDGLTQSRTKELKAYLNARKAT
ncbi:lysozyme inhibitor LprI family protein [Rhizobium sp. BK068]|uniref:lysozyme inhibitor LprI family protein n=1 Tax=unclassified Rhizobium TaxID=2613769 RepID=UPI0032AFAE15